MYSKIQNNSVFTSLLFYYYYSNTCFHLFVCVMISFVFGSVRNVDIFCIAFVSKHVIHFSFHGFCSMLPMCGFQVLSDCVSVCILCVRQWFSVCIVFLGTEWVDPEDPTVIAETELLGAAASIEAAAKKLEQLKPRAKPKVMHMLNTPLNDHIEFMHSENTVSYLCKYICII